MKRIADGETVRLPGKAKGTVEKIYHHGTGPWYYAVRTPTGIRSLCKESLERRNPSLVREV